MSRQFTLPVGVLVATAVFTLATASSAYSHARYDRSEPPAGGTVDGAPFVLKAWYTQELMSKSSLVVRDAAGAQVDLGDGRVDLDDPDRKVMLVSLPTLAEGVYQVNWTTISAEDGDEESGVFTFGVGVNPPSACAEPVPMGASAEAYPSIPQLGDLT